jgi:hypothetical protein
LQTDLAQCSARLGQNFRIHPQSRLGKIAAKQRAKESANMKVTLRNRRTGEYYSGSGSWVASGLQAHNFRYSDAAEEVCEQLGLPDIDVFYIFNRSPMNSGASSDCGSR